LLVGRPVFPGASPLVKLASHHSRTPPQLLDQAPETPPRLRELVESLMRPDPLQRPLSATQLLTTWESTCGAAPALLRQFRREFDAPVPLRRPVRGSRPMAGLAAVALLLVTLWSAGRVSLPVVGRDAELVENGGEGAAPADSSPADSSPANLAGESVTSTGTAADAAKDARNARASADRGRAGLANLQLLPEPNERGELSLSAGACYLARPLNVVGGLVIRAAGTPAPTVVVRAPWQVVAESVRLEGFDIQGELPPQADPEGTLATLDLQAQSLVARQLRMTGVARSPELGGAPPAIRWQLVDLRDTRPTVAEFDSCLFQGGVAVLVTPQPVTAVRLSQRLVVDHEAVLELAGESRRSRVVSLDLNQVTLRGGGGVLRWWGGVGPPSGLQVVLDLKSSVVEATSDSLVNLISSRRGSEWRGRLRIRGDGALVSPDQPLRSWRSGQTGEAQPLSTDGFSVEGVLTGPLEFVGNRPDHPADSVLRSVAGPRRSAAEPGMDPRRLRADPGLLSN